MRVVSAKQMAEIEKASDKCGVTYSMLMNNAGRGLGNEIEKLAKNKKSSGIVFLCGSGNNGGDCFVAARYLKEAGFNVSVALIYSMPKTQISQSEFDKMNGVPVYEDIDEIKKIILDSRIVVDGIFGTGFHGNLDNLSLQLLNLNDDALKIAVDIPSGGNSTKGSVCDGCFHADYTVTFGFKKIGMTQYPLKEYCGKVILVDIGIPDECKSTDYLSAEEIDEQTISGVLKPRKPDSHKGTYGTLLCITGSGCMPGASIMSGEAALRCGCGIVKLCSAEKNIAPIASRIPEIVFVKMDTDKDGFYTENNYEKITQTASGADAVLIGCGLGVTNETQNLVKKIITTADCPVILDADGINCICGCIDIIKEANTKIILTPHPAEMARLLQCRTSEIQADRLKICSEFTDNYKNTVLVLKGAGTIISVNGKMYINNTGNAGMSCGGSGDVLSGMIASFAAQGTDPLYAAVMGVNMHGKAGDTAAQKYSMNYMLPSDIIKELPQIFLNIK